MHPEEKRKVVIWMNKMHIGIINRNVISEFLLKNDELEWISTLFSMNNLELLEDDEREIVDCARSCSGSCSGDCWAHCNGDCFTSCEGSCSMFEDNDDW